MEISRLLFYLPRKYSEALLSLKTLAEKIRSPDKKCAAVAFKTLFKLSRDRAETVVVEIVVIADVKCRSGIRIPTEKKLSARV